jgi:hypothetical protein
MGIGMSSEQDLYSRIENDLPGYQRDCLPIVRESINAISDLPGLENWTPSAKFCHELLPVGLPLGLLSESSGCELLKRRIATTLLKEAKPAPGDFAEISGAALCVALGATKIHQVRTSTIQTPDFIISWPSQAGSLDTDLEITSAAMKVSHIERNQTANRIAHQLHCADRMHDIVLHYIDPPTEADLSQIMKAASKIKPEEVIQDPGKWIIRAAVPDRAPSVLLVAGIDDNSPDWWPRKQITGFVVNQVLAGPGAKIAPPQTRVHYCVPFTAYINPVQKKADYPQGGDSRPFIIAIDITDLPGAYQQFRKLLIDYFPLWSRVSAILTFSQWTHPSRIGWRWGLLPNPDSRYALSEDILQKLMFDNERDSFFLIREQDKHS